MLENIDERIVKSVILSYLHKIIPDMGVLDLQLSVDAIVGNDVAISLVYPNVELRTDTTFPVPDKVWEWYFKYDSYNRVWWERKQYLSTGLLQPISWWSCKFSCMISFDEVDGNFVSTSNTQFAPLELLKMERYMWLLKWKLMQMPMFEKGYDGKAIPANLIDFNPVLLTNDFKQDARNASIPIYLETSGKIKILGESLNRQLAKEQRLVERIDMRRDDLEDLMISIDDSGHQVLYSIPDLDEYSMKYTIDFLDDLGELVSSNIQKYVKSIEYSPDLLENAKLVRDACTKILSGIPIYLQAINEFHENHTRPRLLFFKGARQEEIDAFEEQVNEFTIKMKYLLICVDKLTGRT